MIDINADIISYKSLGNIEIGHDVEFYADELYENFDVEERTWEKPCSSNEVGYELKYIYSLNNGTITISTNSNGRIEDLWCNQNYKGKYRNKYKNELYAGITMGELLNLTKKQLIFWGELILDDDYGMAIALPDPRQNIRQCSPLSFFHFGNIVVHIVQVIASHWLNDGVSDYNRFQYIQIVLY